MVTQSCRSGQLSRRLIPDSTAAPVTTYKIRILREDGQTLLIESRFIGDHAAIRRAQTLAMPNDLVEVWCGLVCVYQTATGASIDRAGSKP